MDFPGEKAGEKHAIEQSLLRGQGPVSEGRLALSRTLQSEGTAPPKKLKVIIWGSRGMEIRWRRDREPIVADRDRWLFCVNDFVICVLRIISLILVGA